MALLLEKLWLDLTSNYKLDDSASSKWLEAVKFAYRRENYYNLEYLNSKLAHFESCRGVLSQPFHILVAIIFQTFCYEAKSCGNVEKNIERFKEFVKETGLEKDSVFVEAVKTLLEQQSTGNVEEEEPDSAGDNPQMDSNFKDGDRYYFMDINFSHLASDWVEYLSSSRQTRSEYASMNDEAYMRLRKKVLQNFLLIPNIFATKLFRQKYEAKARENIQNEIDNVLK